MSVNFRFMCYRDLSWRKQHEAGGRLPERPSMNTEAYLKAFESMEKYWCFVVGFAGLKLCEC